MGARSFSARSSHTSTRLTPTRPMRLILSVLPRDQLGLFNCHEHSESSSKACCLRACGHLVRHACMGPAGRIFNGYTDSHSSGYALHHQLA